MTTPREREALIEEVVSAYRPRTADGVIRASSAWNDLEREDREVAFDETLAARKMEMLLDEEGCSSTARAILARLSR